MMMVMMKMMMMSTSVATSVVIVIAGSVRQVRDGGRAAREEDRPVDGPRSSRWQRDDDDAALQGVQAAIQQSACLRERHQGLSTQRRLQTAGRLHTRPAVA